ncbi:MAG: hypothetical protein K2X55_21435 [Burkholderiaceae bacterium]|nr:hypothetical protein [Burkholderiaceae bacterium]
MKIEVDGAEYVEDVPAVILRVAPAPRAIMPPMPAAKREFLGRMDNWRRVVQGGVGGAGNAACAAWAKWYVALRTVEEPPAQDVLDSKVKPPAGLVTADQLDGWLIEAAWRTLGDFNDRQALKSKYIYQLPDALIRRKLVGVRGPHVALVVARAENKLKAILKRLENPATIRLTTCLPGCPVPTVESTLP